jgi:predicted neutral ceramidase superfamily lipid hydrolase
MSRVFVREATGLVRDISPYQLMFFNFLTAPILNTLMWSLNWNPSMFPGFDFNTGLLIVALLAVPMYLTYSIVYTAFPKTGTDYVLQSRILNPSIGFSATFAAWFFFQFWFISVNGITIVEMFLMPWLFNLAQCWLCCISDFP